ncbi:MAG: NAD-dependent dihydropyrimidine dehydrogenase subunit PreA [Negativicutes bacterium]|nr:NAD-dependent dihydropyrimidine dehydrogenase subunit PreA [Negativicutes bacterium]
MTKAVDLTTDFCGVRFPNPFILASGPVTDTPEKVIRAFRMGWGGAILKTISMEPEKHTQVKPRFGRVKHGADTIGFTNMEVSSTHTLEWWVETVRKIKREYPENPIFASIMRTSSRTRQDWVTATEAFQDAGADGIELNFSCSHAFHSGGGGASIGKDPDATKTIVEWVMSVARVPVVAKLTVATSYIAQIAQTAIKAGANGITAINSVPGVAGFDLDTFTPSPAVDGFSSFTGYSGPAIKPIGLRCVGEILRVNSVPLMGCGGIWNWRDAAEYMLMGANAVQLCTAPMFQGFDMIDGLTKGLTQFLAGRGLAGPGELVGAGLPSYKEHSLLSKAYSVVAEIDQAKCIKCQACYRACRDSANEAIAWSDEGPSIVSERCIGCSLCRQVCRQKGCISMVQV